MFLVTLLAGSSALLAGDQGKAPTKPGKYTQWRGPCEASPMRPRPSPHCEIDELEVVETFKLGDYQRVVVAPFDTAGTKLPESDDNTYEPVKKVLADVSTPLLEGLKSQLPKGLSASADANPAGDPGALVVRGKVEVMDPGSKAARSFLSFGAGAARAILSGEIADASGRVLLRFKQERRSAFGMFGGDYVKLMNRNLRAIGEDLADALGVF